MPRRPRSLSIWRAAGRGAWGAWSAAGLALFAQATCADPGPANQTSLSNLASAAVNPNTVATPGTTPMACGGTPSECNAISDANACNQQNGCDWIEAFCYSPSCGDYNDQATCEAKACKWVQACGGTAQPCFKSTQESLCNARAKCEWGSGSCTGYPPYCSALTNDAAACRRELGCSADVGCSESAAVRCIDFDDSASCQAGPRCAWQTAHCAGSVLPCGIVNDANACAEQAGCKWGAAP